jgi:tRNA threonylcarbamoyladenosine biosynthesis protein TsaE
MEYLSESLEETKEIAENIAKELKKERIFALRGELGVGKTAFIQGFAKGLGISENIKSPTFVLMNKFCLKKKRNFYHFDFYRIKNKKEVQSLSLEDIFSNKDNIICIEWPERIKSILPKDTVYIKIKILGENKRKIIYGE